MSDALLLDTCAAIWITEGEPVSEQALAALSRAHGVGAKVNVSPITAWEIGLLTSKGRLVLRSKPHSWFRALSELPGVAVADLTSDILIDASYLPSPIHSDPADRMIIATARHHDLTILTRDRRILDYAAQGHVRALAC